MFDLPTTLKEESKAAAAFRKSLLDMGFEMSQFSVYMRFCSSATQVETYARKVEACLPSGGKVHILQITDKQYERIISYHGKSKQAPNKTPEQFVLF